MINIFCFWGGRCILIFKNKRSESEIMYQLLLLATTNEVRKTHLMYKTNLCYNHFIEYMNFLLEKKLLEAKGGNPTGSVYYTTEKGKKLLETIKNELEMMS